jgi:Uma2 family endonuclease
MSATIIQELAAHPELIHRHTVDEYHDMIAAGLIAEGEPYELLDGQIVRKIRSKAGEDIMTVGVEHAIVVTRLARLTTAFEPKGCHIRSQQPIVILPDDEPEPDAAIVRGDVESYTAAHPEPADILCVIEVSDSSLSRDRIYKQKLYANANIPMYVIVNLIDRVVEVYREPVAGSGCYASVTPSIPPHSILLPTVAGDSVELPTERLFAPPSKI